MKGRDKRKIFRPTKLNFSIPLIQEEHSPLKIVHSYLEEKKMQESIEVKPKPSTKSSWTHFSFSKMSLKPKKEFRLLSEVSHKKKSNIIPIHSRPLKKLRVLKMLKKSKPSPRNSLIIEKIRSISSQSSKSINLLISFNDSKSLPNLNRKPIPSIPKKLNSSTQSRLSPSPSYNTKIDEMYKKILNIKHKQSKIY